MTVKELIEKLSALNQPDMDVEVAVTPNPYPDVDRAAVPIGGGPCVFASRVLLEVNMYHWDMNERPKGR